MDEIGAASRPLPTCGSGLRSFPVGMDELAEIRLSGGRVNEVVRVGETVRRPLGPQSAFVHEVLTRLEGEGFDAAPRFLGIDEKGREILSLLPGAPLPGTSSLADDQLRSAAHLLRRYHDAVAAAFRGRLGGPCETVVHGDVGPWNLLWLGSDAVALIDFDNARPGARLEDLGYFAWKGLRLVSDGPDLLEQRRRLALLAHTYGVAADDELVDAIDRAMTWLWEKGSREAWPGDALARIGEERRWVQQARQHLI
jgi:Phosphotransferase enzyme family